jgi:hypothetical protein
MLRARHHRELPQVKIGTWNLEGVRPNGRERTSYIRDRLAEVSADVWILTETHPDFAPGDAYQMLAKSSVGAYRTDGCWVAIWARSGIAGLAHAMSAEEDRAAGVLVERSGAAPLWIFGTVLPWRSDTRHADLRGAAAFESALLAQSREWTAARSSQPQAELCVAGDFNQEVGTSGLVGSRRGGEALDALLITHGLTCVTGTPNDPLQAHGYGTSIDHVLLSSGLRVDGSMEIWPNSATLPREAPDHYGVSVTVASAYA